MKKSWFILIFILLFVLSGCSNTPDKDSSDLTNNNSSINSSPVIDNSKSVNDITSIDIVDETSDTNSISNAPIFKKKNITKIELLERAYETSTNGKKIYGKNFVVSSTFDNGEIINKMSDYLFGEDIIKSVDSWGKFKPAHANYKALNVYCDDGTKYIVNLHFDENSEAKYIAVATVNSKADYNDFVNQSNADNAFEKCIATNEFGEFLIQLY